MEKKYDLEERTFRFARDVIEFVNKLKKSLATIEVGKQLIRAAGSVGANYIEANEGLSRKDYVMRVKICRKEAKEAGYWLRLIDCNEDLEVSRAKLIIEAGEFTKIFGAIIVKCKS
jgi:four helix bundle protein